MQANGQTETAEYIKRLENDESVSISYALRAANVQFGLDEIRDTIILKSGVDELYWIGLVGVGGLILTEKINFSLFRWQTKRFTLTPRLFIDNGETKGFLTVKL